MPCGTGGVTADLYCDCMGTGIGTGAIGATFWGVTLPLGTGYGAGVKGAAVKGAHGPGGGYMAAHRLQIIGSSCSVT